jgi:hypothetical protein
MALPSGATLVTVSATAGTGCGDFGASLGAAWELGGPTPKLVTEPDGQGLVPSSAGDVDGDGRVEMIFPEGVLRSSGARYDRWEQLVIPFLDCGC